MILFLSFIRNEDEQGFKKVVYWQVFSREQKRDGDACFQKIEGVLVHDSLA